MEMIQREPHIAVDQLARISAPTLVIAGDDDPVYLEHTASLFRAVCWSSSIEPISGTLQGRRRRGNSAALAFVHAARTPPRHGDLPLHRRRGLHPSVG